MATPSISKAKALIPSKSILGLASTAQRTKIGQVERSAALLRALAATQVNDAELGLVLGNVVKKGVHQALGMLRGHDDAVANLRLGQPGQGSGKVNDELAAGMRV